MDLSNNKNNTGSGYGGFITSIFSKRPSSEEDDVDSFVEVNPPTEEAPAEEASKPENGQPTEEPKAEKGAEATTEAPSAENETETPNTMSELDLVFVVDNTGSMSPWIRNVQQNIQKIINEIVTAEASDVRFALVSYRDHPPQDTSFVTQTHEFTENVSDMQGLVNRMAASGGGDFPEAVAAALYDAKNLAYRPNSAKVVVLVADAPPHGIGVHGDGFPNGCPLGHDPLKIVREMGEMGITIYTVICGNFEGQAFYQSVAQMSGGQYVPLKSAHLLAGVIVGGAQEEIALERLMKDAEETVQAEEEAAGRSLDEDELATKLGDMFKAKKAVCRHTRFAGAELPEVETSAAAYCNSASLSDVRVSGDRSHLSFGGWGDGYASSASGGAAFAASYDEVSMKQCKRMATKSKLRSKGGFFGKSG